MSNFIFYHNDPDGIMACAVMLYDKRNIEYIDSEHRYKNSIAINYNDNLSKDKFIKVLINELNGKHIYLLDYTFTEEQVQYLANIVRQYNIKLTGITIIDHHKLDYDSYIENLADVLLPIEYRGRIYKFIDTNHSGCFLTWQYKYKDLSKYPPHKAVLLVEDYDIWKWEYKETNDFVTGIIPLEINDYVAILRNLLPVKEVVYYGRIVDRYKQKLAERFFKDKKISDFILKELNIGNEKYTIILINKIVESLKHSQLVLQNKFGDRYLYAFYTILPDGVTISFRGKGALKVARYFYGGGHPEAAGCKIDLKDFISIFLKRYL